MTAFPFLFIKARYKFLSGTKLLTKLKTTLTFSVKSEILSSELMLYKFSKPSMFVLQNFSKSNLNLKFANCPWDNSIWNFSCAEFGKSYWSWFKLDFALLLFNNIKILNKLLWLILMLLMTWPNCNLIKVISKCPLELINHVIAT